MKRLLLGVILVTGCEHVLPVAPDVQLSTAAVTAHLDHTAFTSYAANTPIAHRDSFFHPGPSGQAYGKATFTPAAGTALSRFRVQLHVTTTGLLQPYIDTPMPNDSATAGGRILDVAFMRLVGGDAAVLLGWLSVYTGEASGRPDVRTNNVVIGDGWHIRSSADFSEIANGTSQYMVLASLRDAAPGPAPSINLRVAWVEVESGPASPSAPLLTNAAVTPIETIMHNLATRYVMP